MFKKKFALAGAALALSATAHAVPVTFIAADDGVSSLAHMVNAQAAQADFLAITGPLNVTDFESPISGDITITGGSTVNLSSCGPLCGFNTTAGGTFHREVVGGSVTFSFTNPVDAFGFYVNGLQTNLVPQQTIVYTDGSSATQTIDFPSAINGGGAFVGFVDFGQLIASVTFNATRDILGFDDLLFGRSANDPTDPMPVPEPLTRSLLGAGLSGIGFSRRRRRQS